MITLVTALNITVINELFNLTDKNVIRVGSMSATMYINYKQ